MMGYMIDEVDQVALANQQDVVRNERRQRFENEPYGIVNEALYHALYPKDHPHYAVVIGSHADIQAATLKDVKSFFKTYYRPNNATLALAGDFDKARAKQLIEKYFGPLKAGDKPPAVTATQPRITAEKRVVVTDRIELPRVYLAWHTPAILKPGDAELDLASHVLAGGKSSRLYKTLVYDRQIAQDVSASQYSLTLGSIFSIDATARPGHTTAELEKAIDEELTKLATTPPSEDELTRARNTLETRLYRSLEKVMGVADQLNSYNQIAGDPGYLGRDILRYRNVKPADVSRVIAEQLKKQARVVIEAKPGKQQLAAEVPTPPVPTTADKSEREAVNADEPWRSQRPKPGPASPLALPAGKPFRLPNGLTVVHVANPGVPVVSATLVVKAAPAPTHPIARGWPASRPPCCRRGPRTARPCSWRTTSPAWGPRSTCAPPATTRACRPPRCGPASRGARAAGRRAGQPGLRHPGDRAAEEEPPGRAGAAARESRLHRRRGGGRRPVRPRAPVGRSPLGTEAAINATTAEDLTRFWSTHYRPDRAALVVSGDITLADLKEIVQSRLGGWKTDAAAPKIAPPRPATTPARLVLVDKPGAAQTALFVTSFGPRASDPILPQLTVMNAILGGNFTSRINHTLREVKGYSYGVYSNFAAARDVGLFIISGSVRTDVTGSAVTDLFAEIEGVRKQPVPAAELQDARNSQLLSLPGMFDTNAVIAGSLAAAWSRGQGLDYYARLPGRLARVDAATAHKLARKYVRPDDLVVVAVGDKAKIAAQLAGTRKPVETRDVDGNPVKAPGL